MRATYVYVTVFLVLIGGGTLSALLGSPRIQKVFQGMSTDRLIYLKHDACMMQKRLRWFCVSNFFVCLASFYLRFPELLSFLFFTGFLVFIVVQRLYSKLGVRVSSELEVRGEGIAAESAKTS